MDSALDDITRVLFAQMRGVDENKDLDTLLCPKCRDRLEPILLDVEQNSEDGITYQHIWWTCRGLKKKTCFFPLNMPSNVYWTRRTMEQLRDGFLPLPNFHLLPKEYYHLYPGLFKGSSAKNVSQISQVSTFSKIPYVKMNKVQKLDKMNLPGTSLAPNKTFESLQMYAPFGNISVNREDSVRELNKDSIKYCDGNRRNVELFTDPDSALESNLSLQYCTDEFLSTINSEMSRKQLIKPHLAIGQRQRIRMTNIIDKLNSVNVRNLEQAIQDTDLQDNDFPKDKDVRQDEQDPIEEDPEPQPSSSQTNQDSNFIIPELLEMDENYSDITNQNTLTSDFTTTLTNVTPSNPSESSTNETTSKRRKKCGKGKTRDERIPFNSFGDPELDNLIKRKYMELVNSGEYGVIPSTKKRSRTASRKRRTSKNNAIKSQDLIMETPVTTRMSGESSSQIRVVDEHGYAIDMPEFNLMEDLGRPLDDFSSYFDF